MTFVTDERSIRW